MRRSAEILPPKALGASPVPATNSTGGVPRWLLVIAAAASLLIGTGALACCTLR